MASEGALTAGARHAYHGDCESAVNRQINTQLSASQYAHFDRDDVALHGHAKFFHHRYEVLQKQAEDLVKYQTMRGGRPVLGDIAKPPQNEWLSPLDAIQSAIQLEKNLNEALLELTAIAQKHRDPQLNHELRTFYLREKVDVLSDLAGFATNLKRVGPGLGAFEFDENMPHFV